MLLLSVGGLSADSRTATPSGGFLYSDWSPSADGATANGGYRGSFIIYSQPRDISGRVLSGWRRVLENAVEVRGDGSDWSRGVIRRAAFGDGGIDWDSWESLGRARAAGAVSGFHRVLNSELARAVSVAGGELSFVRKLEVDLDTGLGERPANLGVSALGSFREVERSLLAWQLRGYNASGGRKGVNAGIIKRFISADNRRLLGGNIFLDYENDEVGDFWRASIGGEGRNEWLDFSANYYVGLSDAVRTADGTGYYSADGYEARLYVQIPRSSRLSAGLTYYHWIGEYGNADDSGLRYGVRVRGVDIPIVAEVEYDRNDGDNRLGARFYWWHNFGEQRRGDRDRGRVFDARRHLFAPVSREHVQRIKKFQDNPPAIALSAPAINIQVNAASAEPLTRARASGGSGSYNYALGGDAAANIIINTDGDVILTTPFTDAGIVSVEITVTDQNDDTLTLSAPFIIRVLPDLGGISLTPTTPIILQRATPAVGGVLANASIDNNAATAGVALALRTTASVALSGRLLDLSIDAAGAVRWGGALPAGAYTVLVVATHSDQIVVERRLEFVVRDALGAAVRTITGISSVSADASYDIGVVVRVGQSADIIVLRVVGTGGNTVSYTYTKTGGGGALAVDGDGNIRFSVTPSVSGADEITVRIEDGDGTAHSEIIRISATVVAAPLLSFSSSLPGNAVYFRTGAAALATLILSPPLVGVTHQYEVRTAAGAPLTEPLASQIRFNGNILRQNGLPAGSHQFQIAVLPASFGVAPIALNVEGVDAALVAVSLGRNNVVLAGTTGGALATVDIINDGGNANVSLGLRTGALAALAALGGNSRPRPSAVLSGDLLDLSVDANGVVRWGGALPAGEYAVSVVALLNDDILAGQRLEFVVRAAALSGEIGTITDISSVSTEAGYDVGVSVRAGQSADIVLLRVIGTDGDTAGGYTYRKEGVGGALAVNAAGEIRFSTVPTASGLHEITVRIEDGDGTAFLEPVTVSATFIPAPLLSFSPSLADNTAFFRTDAAGALATVALTPATAGVSYEVRTVGGRPLSGRLASQITFSGNVLSQSGLPAGSHQFQIAAVPATLNIAPIILNVEGVNADDVAVSLDQNDVVLTGASAGVAANANIANNGGNGNVSLGLRTSALAALSGDLLNLSIDGGGVVSRTAALPFGEHTVLVVALFNGEVLAGSRLDLAVRATALDGEIRTIAGVSSVSTEVGYDIGVAVRDGQSADIVLLRVEGTGGDTASDYSYSKTGGGPTLAVDPDNGEITFSTVPSVAGLHEIIVRIEDGDGTTVAETVTISVSIVVVPLLSFSPSIPDNTVFFRTDAGAGALATVVLTPANAAASYEVRTAAGDALSGALASQISFSGNILSQNNLPAGSYEFQIAALPADLDIAPIALNVEGVNANDVAVSLDQNDVVLTGASAGVVANANIADNGGNGNVSLGLRTSALAALSGDLLNLSIDAAGVVSRNAALPFGEHTVLVVALFNGEVLAGSRLDVAVRATALDGEIRTIASVSSVSTEAGYDVGVSVRDGQSADIVVLRVVGTDGNTADGYTYTKTGGDADLVVGEKSGEIRFSTVPDSNGLHEIIVGIEDGDGTTATETVTISVSIVVVPLLSFNPSLAGNTAFFRTDIAGGALATVALTPAAAGASYEVRTAAGDALAGALASQISFSGNILSQSNLPAGSYEFQIAALPADLDIAPIALNVEGVNGGVVDVSLDRNNFVLTGASSGVVANANIANNGGNGKVSLALRTSASAALSGELLNLSIDGAGVVSRNSSLPFGAYTVLVVALLNGEILAQESLEFAVRAAALDSEIRTIAGVSSVSTEAGYDVGVSVRDGQSTDIVLLRVEGTGGDTSDYTYSKTGGGPTLVVDAANGDIRFSTVPSVAGLHEIIVGIEDGDGTTVAETVTISVSIVVAPILSFNPSIPDDTAFFRTDVAAGALATVALTPAAAGASYEVRTADGAALAGALASQISFSGNILSQSGLPAGSYEFQIAATPADLDIAPIALNVEGVNGGVVDVSLDRNNIVLTGASDGVVANANIADNGGNGKVSLALRTSASAALSGDLRNLSIDAAGVVSRNAALPFDAYTVLVVALLNGEILATESLEFAVRATALDSEIRVIDGVSSVSTEATYDIGVEVKAGQSAALVVLRVEGTGGNTADGYTYTKTGGAPDLAVDGDDGEIRFSTVPTANGLHEIIIRVADGDGTTLPLQTITISVSFIVVPLLSFSPSLPGNTVLFRTDDGAGALATVILTPANAAATYQVQTADGAALAGALASQISFSGNILSQNNLPAGSYEFQIAALPANLDAVPLALNVEGVNAGAVDVSLDRNNIVLTGASDGVVANANIANNGGNTNVSLGLRTSASAALSGDLLNLSIDGAGVVGRNDLLPFGEYTILVVALLNDEILAQESLEFAVRETALDSEIRVIAGVSSFSTDAAYDVGVSVGEGQSAALVLLEVKGTGGNTADGYTYTKTGGDANLVVDEDSGEIRFSTVPTASGVHQIIVDVSDEDGTTLPPRTIRISVTFIPTPILSFNPSLPDTIPSLPDDTVFFRTDATDGALATVILTPVADGVSYEVRTADGAALAGDLATQITFSDNILSQSNLPAGSYEFQIAALPADLNIASIPLKVEGVNVGALVLSPDILPTTPNVVTEGAVGDGAVVTAGITNNGGNSNVSLGLRRSEDLTSSDGSVLSDGFADLSIDGDGVIRWSGALAVGGYAVSVVALLNDDILAEEPLEFRVQNGDPLIVQSNASLPVIVLTAAADSSAVYSDFIDGVSGGNGEYEYQVLFPDNVFEYSRADDELRLTAEIPRGSAAVRRDGSPLTIRVSDESFPVRTQDVVVSLTVRSAPFLFLIGGCSNPPNNLSSSSCNGAITRDVWELKESGWERVSQTAPAVYDAAVVAHYNDIYILGGYTNRASPPTPSNNIWISSDFGVTWTTLGIKLPTARAGGRAFVRQNVLYLMGGERNTANPDTSVIHRLDLDADPLVWETVAENNPDTTSFTNPPVARLNVGSAYFRNSLYIAGGDAVDTGTEGETAIKAMSSTTPSDNAARLLDFGTINGQAPFSQAPVLPADRRQPELLVVGDQRMYLIGGGVGIFNPFPSSFVHYTGSGAISWQAADPPRGSVLMAHFGNHWYDGNFSVAADNTSFYLMRNGGSSLAPQLFFKGTADENGVLTWVRQTGTLPSKRTFAGLVGSRNIHAAQDNF